MAKTKASHQTPIDAANTILSQRSQQWLLESVFSLSDGVSYSRRAMSILTESPCTRAARILHHVCFQYRITTLAQLESAGLDGLLRCTGMGERSSWIAALILADHGRDVDAWLRRKSKSGSWKGALRLVHNRTRKQKH